MSGYRGVEHDAEPRRVVRGRDFQRERTLNAGWQAVCSCGWVGPIRHGRDAADQDAHEHHMAEIPNDMEGSIYR